MLLQRFISEPILNLAKFTKSISESPDYGQRIENTYQDEVGTLYNSFNSMLDAIESTTVSRGYLNDILSSMAEMLIVLDNDFNIQKINEAVSEQMQYSSSELIGKKIDILLKRNTAEAFYQNEQVETNFYTKSGERKVVAISLSGLNTKSQNSSTIICTARDITEQQLAKEQLKRNFEELQLTQEQLKIAKELAEASSKAKSEFLSKMSHEIRTPMNAIIGMAHLLLQNNPQHEQKDDLKDLLLSSESLLTLINDILDFSHIEAGQVIFQKREFNIHNLVQNVVRSLRQDHVGMNLSIDERIPKIVKGDQKRLLQILTNLIHNAVKFTQKGEVSVDVKLDSYDAFKTYLSFSVEDTGVGIPEDKIGLIFESFSQVDNSLTRQYQGKGLALATLLQLHTLVEGDFFAVALPKIHVDHALSHARTLLASINSMNFTWQDTHFHTNASIGLVPLDAELGGDEAMSTAKIAVQLAGEKGNNVIELQRPDNTEISARKDRMRTLNTIHAALEGDHFELYCQGIYPTNATEHPHHYEILLRLHDEAGNFISPDQLIPAAEYYKVMPDIDRWVIRNTLQALSNSWHFLENSQQSWAINLSGLTFTQPGLLDFISEELAVSGIPASMIAFEVTETVAVDDLNSARKIIEQVQALGCEFYLDDFGTGLSSFTYLQQLPFNHIKIDGSFIKNVVEDEVAQAMVKAISDVAHVLGMKTVAEYVENDAIIEKLKTLGVEYLQGYGLHKPTALHSVLAELDSWQHSQARA